MDLLGQWRKFPQGLRVPGGAGTQTAGLSVEVEMVQANCKNK